MLELMKQIRMIIGHQESFSFEVCDKHIYFNMYNNECNIPIVFDGVDLYLDCETTNEKIYSSTIAELNDVCEFILSKKDELYQILQVGDVE